LFFYFKALPRRRGLWFASTVIYADQRLTKISIEAGETAPLHFASACILAKSARQTDGMVNL
jgi:hypothetical protein